jgi:hypothetical protein
VIQYSDLDLFENNHTTIEESLNFINLGFNEQFVDRYKGW